MNLHRMHASNTKRPVQRPRNSFRAIPLPLIRRRERDSQATRSMMAGDWMRIERKPADSRRLLTILRGRETDPDTEQGISCSTKDFVDVFGAERTYEPIHALGEGGGVIVYNVVEEVFFFGGVFEGSVD